MNTRKVYRLIVLIVCLLALVAGMLACSGGDGCYKNSDGILVCNSANDLMHNVQSESFTDKAKEVVKQANQDISQNAAEFVDQHNDGTQWMDSKCMSFFEDCE